MPCLQPPNSVILVDVYRPLDGTLEHADLFLRLDVAIEHILRGLADAGILNAVTSRVSVDNAGQVNGIAFFSCSEPKVLLATAAVYYPHRDTAKPELACVRALQASRPFDLETQLNQVLLSNVLH